MSKPDFFDVLAEAQDALLADSGHLESVGQRLASGDAPGRAAGAFPWPVLALPVLGGGVVLAAAAAVALVFASPAPEPTPSASPAVVAVAPPISGSTSNGQPLKTGALVHALHAETFSFTDGTTVQLAPDSKAKVVSFGVHGAEIVLDRGRGHFDVVHTDTSDWMVGAGPFQVAVTGTVFDLTWSPDEGAFLLQMIEGSTTVTGPQLGEGRVVRGDELLRIELSPRVATKADASSAGLSVSKPSPRPIAAPSTDTPAELPLVDEPQGLADNPPMTWSELAMAGDHAEAVSLAKELGLAQEIRRASPGDVVALGDAARFNHDWKTAKKVYKALRAQHQGTEEASLAAFHLGVMATDRSGDPKRTVAMLEAYLAESPQGGLAEQALGRLIEARHSAGDSVGARAAAIDYLRRFPAGAHSAYAKRKAIID